MSESNTTSRHNEISDKITIEKTNLQQAQLSFEKEKEDNDALLETLSNLVTELHLKKLGSDLLILELSKLQNIKDDLQTETDVMVA